MNKVVTKITSSLLLCSLLTYTTPIFAYTREESVYTKSKANGENYKTIVSTHLINENQEEFLNDISDLVDIENINGNEEFTKDGEKLTWSANGSDIYYKGETKKELPIKCNIKYELDGKEIKPEEIAGKSGKVKITITYENVDEHKVNVNGRFVSMYTPFTVVCGTIFDNTKNTNIEVSSGKVVNDGTKTIVMGIALPGMQESLNISKSTINIPNSIVITLDSKEYEQNNIITFVSPKIIKEKISFNEINEIYNKIDEMKEASQKLSDGANELKDGTTKFNEGSRKFLDGMNQLEEGSKKINQNYDKINNGIDTLYSSSTQLKYGAGKLNEGINELSNGTSELNKGVIQGKKQAVNSLKNSASSLSDGIDMLIEGKDNETQTIKQMIIEAPNSKLKQGLVSNITKAINSSTENTKTNLITVLNNEELNFTQEQKLAIIAALGDGVDTTALETQISNSIDEMTANQKNGLDQINNSEKGLKAGLNSFKIQSTTALTQGTEAIASGFDNISNGVTKLDTGANQLKEGSKQIYDGTINLEEGTNKLSEGSAQMKEGLNKLSESTTILTGLYNQLADAANSINMGSIQLAEGIEQFNTQAIDKIYTYINSDLRDVVSRAEKLQELSQEYSNFTKAEEGKAKEVKFIITTDAIRIKEKNNDDNLDN